MIDVDEVYQSRITRGQSFTSELQHCASNVHNNSASEFHATLPEFETKKIQDGVVAQEGSSVGAGSYQAIGKVAARTEAIFECR
jgi:hypothetical protein